MLLVQVGPKERQQRVAPVEPPRRADREVGQERQPLGLPEDGADLATVRVAEVEGAQGVEADHGRRMAGRAERRKGVKA